MQPASPFLRLPGELRNQIYVYVFTGWNLRPILYADGSIVMASVDDLQGAPGQGTELIRETDIPNAASLTCRQMHAETKNMLYKYSKYELRWQYDFTKWLNMVDDELRAVVWEGLDEYGKGIVQLMEEQLRRLGHVNLGLMPSAVKKTIASRTTL